ncbi:hypothetical protein B4U84_11640 [Westiellopsis prolifica IICB1]|nr:hypothetical protein B4U84_11640 [Westiellopsis prolifica IICB1]
MFLTKLLIPSKQQNKFLEEERITLREKQDRTLATDVKSVLSCRQWIQAKTNNTLDTTRILGIVAVAKGAENYLPYTIPKIIQQISEVGMMADIIIGLNNGFECSDVINRFALLSEIQIIHLYTEEKLANNVPAQIFDNVICQGRTYCLSNIELPQCRHRIFVMHQKEGQHSAGKIRVLGDIYGSLLLKSIENGWIPPAILVTFDAESQFLVEQNDSVINLESNGLKLIVNQLQNHPEIDILGTRIKSAIYQKAVLDGIEVLMPNFSEEVPPIHWFLDIVYGRYRGYQCKPGGGTVGRTDAIISLLAVISETYPGKGEDAILTVLAKHADFIGDIFLDVICTNKIPCITDMTMDQPPKKAWVEQIYRWIAINQTLKLLYGEHNIRIINGGFPWFIVTKPIKFWKRAMRNEKITLYIVFKKLIFLAIAFVFFRQICKRSLDNPEVIQGNRAQAVW